MSHLFAAYALWERAIIKFVRSLHKIMISMSMPLLFLFVLGGGMGNLVKYGDGLNYMGFIGPGVMGFILLMNSMGNGMNILWDRKLGILKAIVVAPASRASIVVGMAMGAVTTSVIRALIIFVALVLLDFIRLSPWMLFTTLFFMFLMSWSFAAIGIAFASRMTDPETYPAVINLLVMPLFMASNALYPLEALPDWLRVFAYANPLTYGIDGLRYATGFPYHFSPVLDLIVVLLFFAVSTLSCWRLYCNVRL